MIVPISISLKLCLYLVPFLRYSASDSVIYSDITRVISLRIIIIIIIIIINFWC